MRSSLLLVLLTVVGLSQPAMAQTTGLPPRPTPFQFVTDQARLLDPADAKKLESGLRHYADETGTQVVVVTVPSLGGRSVADYGRALGTAWGVGQRGKNNGLVVLVASQEHKVTIQAGSGLRDKITPELTQRVIAQDFGPSFKQNNYFAGLRTGLNELMLAANPSSNPKKQGATASAAGAATAAASSTALGASQPNAMATEPSSGVATPVAPAEPTGPGIGTLVLVVVGIGLVIWLLRKVFSRSAPVASAPDFLPGQPNRPNGGTPNFLPNQPQGSTYGPTNQGPVAGNSGSSGPGIGGILATGAAAAAGAYLGNRMAGGHDATGSDLTSHASAAGFGAGTGSVAGAGSDYFSNRDAASNDNAPDYFSGNNDSAANSGDYFSGNDASYDDTSSDNTGGGGFDSSDDRDTSGSW